MRRFALPFLGIALIAREGALDSPMRRRILEIIEARPGVSVRQIANLAGTTWPNVKYHLLRLESAHLVASRVVGRVRVCYVVDDASEHVVEARALLAERTARLLAAHLVAHPGDGLEEIMRTTGLSQRVVYHHLKRFHDRGLIEHSNESRYRGLRPTAALFNALR